MQKILVLSRFVKEYEPVRLKEEGEKAGFEVDIIKYGQIRFGVKNGSSVIDLGKNRKLSDYDFVVLRSSSKKGSSMVAVKNVILYELTRLNINALNLSTFSKFPLLGKTEQGIALAEADLPTIEYISFGSKLGWGKFLKSDIKFPIITKGRFGSHGRTVKLVLNKQDLEETAKSYKTDSVLIQPVLPVKQWYRCIVVRNSSGDYKYLGEMRHRQKAKYQHPDYNFLEQKLTKLSEEKMERLKQICLKAAQLFDCDYCGIDVLYNEETKDFVIAEVNRTAQFKYFEKRTGVNVAEKIIRFED